MMQFPNTPILDNFDRPDAGPPPSASWANWLGLINTGLEIIGGACYGHKLAAYNPDYWIAAPSGNQEVYADVEYGEPTSIVGVLARLDAPNNNWYELSIKQNLGNNNIYLYRYDDATATVLRTWLDVGAVSKLGLHLNGRNINAWAYRGGAWEYLGTRYDATYATGNIGLKVENGAVQINYADNFGGGSLTSAAFPTYGGLLDDFNRADGPLGANWGDDAQNEGAPAMTVSDNQAATNDALGSGWWSATQFDPVQEVYTDIGTAGNLANVGCSIRLYTRLQNPGVPAVDGYFVAFGKTTEAYAQLESIIAGALDGPEYCGASDLRTGDTIGARIDGDTVTVFYKPLGGVWEAVTQFNTDGLLTGSGYIGFRYYDSTS